MKTFKYVIVMLLCCVVAYPTFAQQPEPTEEGTAKVKIIKNINGEVTVIEKEVPISEKGEIDEMLRDLNISEDLEDNEDIQIIIRQGKSHEEPMRWVERMREHDNRPLLGVYVGSTVEKVITNDSGEETVEVRGSEEGGARISGIVPGSGAEAAGLREGDVITSVDDHAIPSYASLVEAIGSYKAGDEVTVNYEREGVPQSVKATLGERKHETHFMSPEHNFMFEGIPGIEHDALKKMCDPDKAFLGVQIRNREEGEGDKGVYITGTIENTAAAELGLQAGDIIYEINDQAVNSTDELREILGASQAGDEVKVEYLRDGKKEKGSATLKKCEPSQCMPGMNNFHEHLMRSFEGMDWEQFGEKLENQFNSEEFREHMEELEEHLNEMHFEFDMDDDRVGDHRVIAIMIRVDDISASDKDMLQNNNPDLQLNNGLEVDHLKFSPNPSNGQFELNFELSESTPVHIRVFDPAGQEVYSEGIEDFGGAYNNSIDISGNADGTYFLVVEQGGRTFSRKIVVQ